MHTTNLKIEYIPINKLKASEYNPRKASEKEYADLKKSIERFGLVDPIIVNSFKDRKNIIIGGHFRCRVAKDLGYKDVPVTYIKISDLKREKELNLRLNKNLGEFDYDLLANFDEAILTDVGFESDELDRIFALEPDAQDDEIPDDAPAICKTGDIWQLGRHRLMCGDSTKKEDVEKLMGGKKADMVFTDPPYGVNFKYNKYDDNNTKDEHKQFCALWFNILKQYSEFIVITVGFGNEHIFYEFDRNFHHLVWFKKFALSASPIAFARRTEPIFVLGKPPKVRYDTDLFEYGTDREKELNKKHPCPKPVALLNALIDPQTDRDKSIVMDLFLGSGSTLIACEKTNRICYGIEIDPKYCDVIIKRWEDYTNEKGQKSKGS